MRRKNQSAQDAAGILNLDVIDLILIDHRYIKECIDVLIDEKADKRLKLGRAKGLFDALLLHADAEKKAIYAPLKESNEELHVNVLEAEAQHSHLEQKIKTLKPRVQRIRVLRKELEAELKVFAEMVRHHLMEEESELLPKMRENVGEAALQEMGRHFMKLRKFGASDLMDYPYLQDELIQWKDSIQKISSKFLTKMDKFVEDMQH